MGEMGVVGWATVIGVVITAVALYFTIRGQRVIKTPPRPGAPTDTEVEIENSPDATTAGRDVGGPGGEGAHKAKVKVTGSKGATTAGRDVGKD